MKLVPIYWHRLYSVYYAKTIYVKYTYIHLGIRIFNFAATQRRSNFFCYFRTGYDDNDYSGTRIENGNSFYPFYHIIIIIFIHHRMLSSAQQWSGDSRESCILYILDRTYVSYLLYICIISIYLERLCYGFECSLKICLTNANCKHMLRLFDIHIGTTSDIQNDQRVNVMLVRLKQFIYVEIW